MLGHMMGKSMAQTEVIDYVNKNPSTVNMEMLHALYPERAPLFVSPKSESFKDQFTTKATCEEANLPCIYPTCICPTTIDQCNLTPFNNGIH